VPFTEVFVFEKKATKKGTPHNIFERAKMDSTSSTASTSSPSMGSKSKSKSKGSNAPVNRHISREAAQSRKDLSVKVSMDELCSLGIDAKVFAAIPVDLQLEQLSRARFE